MKPTIGHVAASAPELTLVGESLNDDPPRDGLPGSYVRTALYVVGGSFDTRLDVQVVGTDPASDENANALPPMPDRDVRVDVRGQPGLGKVFAGEGSVLTWVEKAGYRVELTGWNLSIKELVRYADAVVLPNLDSCIAVKCSGGAWWHATPEAEKFPGSGPSFDTEGPQPSTEPESVSSAVSIAPS
jgi:hypothetical protein